MTESSQYERYCIWVNNFDEFLPCLEKILPYSYDIDTERREWTVEEVLTDLKEEEYPFVLFISSTGRVDAWDRVPSDYIELTLYDYTDGIFTI